MQTSLNNNVFSILPKGHLTPKAPNERGKWCPAWRWLLLQNGHTFSLSWTNLWNRRPQRHWHHLHLQLQWVSVHVCVCVCVHVRTNVCIGEEMAVSTNHPQESTIYSTSILWHILWLITQGWRITISLLLSGTCSQPRLSTRKLEFKRAVLHEHPVLRSLTSSNKLNMYNVIHYISRQHTFQS